MRKKLFSTLKMRTKMLVLFGGGTTAILLILLTIQLMGIPFLNYQGEYSKQSDNAISAMQSTADLQKANLLTWFTDRFGDLHVTSSLSIIREALTQRAEFRRNLQQMDDVELRHALLDNIALRRVSDHLKVIKNSYGEYEKIDLIEGSYGKTIASTDRLSCGRLHHLSALLLKGDEWPWEKKISFVSLPGENLPSLFLAVAILSDDGTRNIGAIVYQVHIDVLMEQILRTSKTIGADSEVFFVDTKGLLLTPLQHTLRDGKVASPLHYTLRTKAAEFAIWGVDGLIESTDYRGVEVVSVVRHLRITSGFSLNMIISRDRKALYSTVRKALTISIGLSLIGIAMIITLIITFARQLAMPLEKLNKTATLIQDGDMNARVPPVNGLEAMVLAKTFNILADHIQDSQETLEEKVLQRTEALQESEERFRTLVNTIPDLIWLKDQNGAYLSCNTMFARLFGAVESEILGKTDYDYVDEDLADHFRANDIKAMKNGVPISNEETVTFSDDGKEVLLYITKTPMYDNRGRLIGVLGIGRDITEIKNSIEEKRNLQEQLQHSQKLESVGRLAGGVAHDFNNMLSVILGNTELVMGKLPEGNASLVGLREIKKAAERSAALTRQLLAFARKQAITPETLDLDERVEDLLSMLKHLIGENIELIWRPNCNHGLIKIDPTQIEQILVNLCINAKDAIDDIGRITITTGRKTVNESNCSSGSDITPGDYLNLIVSDNGRGISPENLEHIFEPFFTTKRQGEGTGLGLATVYGIVLQNNGLINAVSNVGEGSEIEIYLPREVNHGIEKMVPDEVISSKVGNETILLVEDETTLKEVISRMLQGLGYNVIDSVSPQDAIKLVRDYPKPIHMLITDVIMPEMNGKELSEEIIKYSPSTKCLFISGYTADVIDKHGVLSRDVHFLHKPFSKEELASAARKVLDEARII